MDLENTSMKEELVQLKAQLEHAEEQGDRAQVSSDLRWRKIVEDIENR